MTEYPVHVNVSILHVKNVSAKCFLSKREVNEQ